MTPEIALVLVLLVAAIALLATEVVSADIVALCLVVLLVVGGVLTAEEAFRGFASETVVILACVMALSRRLAQSGIMGRLARAIVRERDPGPSMLTLRLMATSAALSSVFTNTSTTAILIPTAMDIAKRVQVRPGRLLMPIAFASMMGGSATLIGTSTNLAASGAMSRLGLEPIGLFEFALFGLIVTGVGMAVMAVFGPWLLPGFLEGDLKEEPPVPDFMTALLVKDDPRVVGKRLNEIDFDALGITPLAIDREEGRVSVHALRKLLADDRLIVHAQHDALTRLHGDKASPFETALAGAHHTTPKPVFSEAVLMPGAHWIGRTVNSMRNDVAPDLHILALYRRDQSQPADINRMRLKTGDVLLIASSETALDDLRANPDLSLLGTPEHAQPGPAEGQRTLAATALALAVGASGLLPLSVALLSAVLVLALTGRSTLEDTFRLISWRILILIGGISSFGLAMQQSGAAEWLAGGLLVGIAPFGAIAALASLALLTILLTQPMSNAAAALTVLPVAIELAQHLGTDPRPFAVTVTLAASLSFIAPFEPALLLVYGPGGYRFRDFIRAGLPLTVVMLALLLVLVPILWPL